MLEHIIWIAIFGLLFYEAVIRAWKTFKFIVSIVALLTGYPHEEYYEE